MTDNSVTKISFHTAVALSRLSVMRVAFWRGSLTACVLACLFALPVCAQQADPAPNTRGEQDAPVVVQPGAPGQPTQTLPSSTRPTLQPPSAADVEFMQHMIVHHAQAVEMTALIESHTADSKVRTLGERISRSQSDEMSFMKRWLTARTSRQGQEAAAGSSHTRHAASMESSMGHQMPAHNIHTTSDHMLMPGMLTAKQMDALKKAKGQEFDRLFLSGMIQHHNGALAMVKDLFDTAGAGQDAELFNFASDVDSGQRAEIRAMQNLLADKP
jgi:uncharacterized protein (DUF305 family)